jgi:hypothetical protein
MPSSMICLVRPSVSSLLQPEIVGMVSRRIGRVEKCVTEPSVRWANRIIFPAQCVFAKSVSARSVVRQPPIVLLILVSPA